MVNTLSSSNSKRRSLGRRLLLTTSARQQQPPPRRRPVFILPRRCFTILSVLCLGLLIVLQLVTFNQHHSNLKEDNTKNDQPSSLHKDAAPRDPPPDAMSPLAQALAQERQRHQEEKIKIMEQNANQKRRRLNSTQNKSDLVYSQHESITTKDKSANTNTNTKIETPIQLTAAKQDPKIQQWMEMRKQMYKKHRDQKNGNHDNNNNNNNNNQNENHDPNQAQRKEPQNIKPKRTTEKADPPNKSVLQQATNKQTGQQLQQTANDKLQKGQTSVAEKPKANATFVTSNLERKSPTVVKHFRLKRSVPDPPSAFQNRSLPVDPLGPDFDISLLRPTNYTLRSEWHGVLLDGGRHYFEVEWIKRMLDVLALLQYNALHFRLTDDQSFNVRLESHPELAHNVGLFGNKKTYTADELRDIVAYGKRKGITIWPEINVPGHGGGWAGIPGLIVQCPEFICEKGYGVPINVTHPYFRTVLTNVLREVVDIFDNPPFLHLGGDEVDMAEPCLREIGQQMFNYDIFEKQVKEILDDISYPEDQVIRWEMTGQRLNKPRTGKIAQYWFRIPGESAPDWGHNFFASGGLYFDFNEMDMAWKIYLFTRRYYHLPRNNIPLGIVAGTFELDSNFWYDRNVVGRLLAVTMGASKEVEAENGTELYGMYREACKHVGFDDALCDHYGLPFISWQDYQIKWKNVWTKWKERICNRLTYPVPSSVFVKPREQATFIKQSRYRDRPLPPEEESDIFWSDLGMKKNVSFVNLDNSDKKFESLRQIANLTALTKRLVPNAGFVVDLTVSPMAFDNLQLLQHAHSLGLNLMQLRLISDYYFGYKSKLFVQASTETTSPNLLLVEKALVDKASELGIGTIPEITLATHAGGLYNLDYNVPCPEYTCNVGHGVQNVSNPKFTHAAYSLVREIEPLATSGLIHLGSDERASATECFAEAAAAGGLSADFDFFEKKLTRLLELGGIGGKNVIRWSNEENKVYSGRLGDITQCHEGDCRSDNGNAWIATVDLQKGGMFDIYSTTRDLALRHPFAVIAEIGKADSNSIQQNEMLHRMLAFAMGVSDLKEWSRGMFEERFTTLCVAVFGPKTGCEKLAARNESVEEESISNASRKHKLCAERTNNITLRLYRPELQEGTAEVEIHAK